LWIPKTVRTGERPVVEGVGVDVIEIARVGDVVERWGEHFLGKIFTEREIAYARARKNPLHHFAARFAVKEAVAKAVATGWRGGFRWKDVEVENDERGKPNVVLGGSLKSLLRDANVHVSISHSDNVVVGFAIVERN
jgi:holo-[acyl-carrier protein] synthase